jgi:hypothetical protein
MNHRFEEDAVSLDKDEMTTEESRGEAPRRMAGGSFAAGVALGALLGAAVALLFAPASGPVTRTRVRRQLEDAREYVGDEFEDLSKRARKELKRRVG